MPIRLKIVGIQDDTDRIRVFDLDALVGVTLPAYTAGAHLTFNLPGVGARSYSLINWPDAQDSSRYVIAVQREDDGDGGSRAMHSLSVGDTLTADGPKNDFELRDNTGPAVLLAGGVGITPLISMATALQAGGRPFRFVYCSRSADIMGFRDKILETFPQAELFYDDTDPLNLTELAQSLTQETHLYVCGPKGMIDAARAAASAQGHPEDQIHIELFTSAASEDGDTSFEVEIQDTGAVYTIPPGKTIIEVLEADGVDLMYDCQRGDCGICQTDVISGEPDHRDVVLSDAERASNKVMQICVSRARSARLVLDL